MRFALRLDDAKQGLVGTLSKPSDRNLEARPGQYPGPRPMSVRGLEDSPRRRAWAQATDRAVGFDFHSLEAIDVSVSLVAISDHRSKLGHLAFDGQRPCFLSRLGTASSMND